MPKIDVTIIADSISKEGHRPTSIQVTAHRFILVEINTHRVASRSYRSSRAVPAHKLLDEVVTDPAMPVRWMKNQPGMQAAIEMTEDERLLAQKVWTAGAAEAVVRARALGASGLHKQWTNRPLEPYLMAKGIITATEWENIFALRIGPEAQPEFDVLAGKMLEAMRASEPKLLEPGEWHLPYIDQDDYERLEAFNRDSVVRIVSAARCARSSYKVFDVDRKSELHEDQELANRLVESGHWGPFEHQATPDVPKDRRAEILDPPEVVRWLHKYAYWERPDQHGNLVGWRQNRKLYPGENRSFQI